MKTLANHSDRTKQFPTEDAEKDILGLLLFCPRTIGEAIERDLRPGEFVAPHHEAIYAALLELHSNGLLGAGDTPLDVAIVYTRIRAQQTASALAVHGHDAYLLELQNRSPAGVLGDYISIVKRLAIEREAQGTREQLAKPGLGPERRSALAARLRELQTAEDELLIGVSGWPDPQPLPDVRETVPTLAPDMLPSAFTAWLADIAERMQVPLEFPAIPALVSVASLIGRKVAIRPKQYDDWSEVGNFWGLVIGIPGVMKSPAVGTAMEPIKGLEKAAREQYEREHDAAEAKVRAARSKGLEQRITSLSEEGACEAEIDKLRDKLRELQQAVPPMKRYVTHDPTIEKLGPLLKDNPRGLLLYRDEIMGWLRNMDREGHQSDRQFYLTAWNGKDYHSVDRISRDAPLHPMCLSVIGTIQPGPLSKYVQASVAGGGGHDGFVQRFQLAVWPDISAQFQAVDRLPDAKARERALAVFHRIDVMLPGDLGAEGTEGADGVPFLRLSKDAQPEFQRWLSALETRLRVPEGQHEALHAHLSKFRGLCPKLALVFHVIDCADRGGGGPVSLAAVRLAIRWCEFLEAHARRIYGAVLSPEEHEARALAARIQRGQLPDGFSARAVQRKNWSGLGHIEAINRALERLIELGWLRPQILKTEGRHAKAYFFHPKIRAQTKAGADKTDRRANQSQTATENAAC